jgi:hypothetical protein
MECVNKMLQDCDYDVDATIATLLQTLEIDDSAHGMETDFLFNILFMLILCSFSHTQDLAV